MKKFKMKYIENVELIKQLNEEKIDKKYMRRASLLAGIIVLVIACIAYFILSELFKQYSAITWMFKLNVTVFAALIFLVCPTYATISLMIYKYYSQNEKIHHINWFYCFIHEMINVGSLIFSIIATIVLTILLCRLVG